VTSSASSGADTLAAAITNADAANCIGNTISFQADLSTITLTSALPAITAQVTIDGTGSPVITDTGTAGVFSVTGGNVAFEDVTVDGLMSDADGGAISVDDSVASDVVTVTNSTFESDVASTSYSGGAIANDGVSTIDVGGSTFYSDAAASNGGAIVNGSSGTVNVEDGTTFDHDSADDGGAVANISDGILLLDGSDLEHDTATLDGGAIYNDAGGTITVSGGSILQDDQAEDGGAIAGTAVGAVGYVNVDDSSLVGNQAASDGGAIDSADADSGGEEFLAATDDTFTGNDALEGDGGAIDVADHGGLGSANVSGSDFVGNEAAAAGGAIDNGDNGSGYAQLSVWRSTFYGDLVSPAAEGEAIHSDGGEDVDAEIAGDLFAETCGGSVMNFASKGYNAAVPAAGAGIGCSGAGTGDQLNTEVTDVSSQGASGQFTVPDVPNPAIDLIPSGAVTVNASGNQVTICPTTDLLGNSGPDPSGNCDAGAIQSFITPSTPPSSGNGQGRGGTATGGSTDTGSTTTVTSPAPTSTAAPKKTTTTTVKFDNQTITLVSPSMNVCTAAGKSLPATLTSKAIRHSKKTKLKFKLATFTAGGKDKHTAKRVPAKQLIKLKGLKAHGTDKLKVTVSYSKPQKHRKPSTVSKAITVKFKVC
jgi:hypothetical protein